MDIFDRAQELEAFQRDTAITAALPHAQGVSLVECEDCGEEIPAARRTAAKGCTRCLDCQQRHEQRQRGFA